MSVPFPWSPMLSTTFHKLPLLLKRKWKTEKKMPVERKKAVWTLHNAGVLAGRIEGHVFGHYMAFIIERSG